MNVKAGWVCEIGKKRVEIKCAAAYCRPARWSTGLVAPCFDMWERVQDLWLTTPKDGGDVFLRNFGTRQTSRCHIRKSESANFLQLWKSKPVVIVTWPFWPRHRMYYFWIYFILFFSWHFYALGWSRTLNPWPDTSFNLVELYWSRASWWHFDLWEIEAGCPSFGVG